MKHQRPASFMLEHASDFAVYYKELQVTQPGWFHVSQKPPVMKPPPSKHWVKPARFKLRSKG
jgi:hypothetical protein